MADHLPKILDRETVASLMKQPNVKCWSGLRNRTMMETMYRTGLRISEVCSLEPCDIDLDNQWLHVHQGKGGKDRNVPFDNRLLDWFLLWDDARLAASRWWFHTSTKKKVGPSSIRHAMRRYAQKAGIEARGCSPHVLRHCYATEILEEGSVSIRELQELLGHSNLNTTEIYAHVRPQALAAKIIARQDNGEKKDKARELVESLVEADPELLNNMSELLESIREEK